MSRFFDHQYLDNKIALPPGVSLSEEERIRKLEKEIEEVQNLKTTMFNELEVKTKTPTEFDEVVQKCKDMFAGFENTLANIETKMGGRKGE